MPQLCCARHMRVLCLLLPAAFLTLYANGKSAVRVDAPGVRPLGPHFFTGNPSPRWAQPKLW